MYSHLYRYLNIHTPSVGEYWRTADIEKAILRSGLFSYGDRGEFKGNKTFCSVYVLCVKSFESFNQNDYDPVNANYISIVISRQNSALAAEEFFKELAAQLDSVINEVEY